MNKNFRQRAILDLLRTVPLSSQEELQGALRKRGIRVAQATLSRDIRDLGLAKTSAGYSLPQADGAPDPALPPFSRLVREFVLELRPAQNLLVAKTAVGSAQPVAAALDQQDWPEVIGTIAGDDTILMVCADIRGAKKLSQRIEEMLA